MNKEFDAKASTTINAPTARVWDALINPTSIKQYMFGTNVTSDWKKGSRILWKGEWEGKAYVAGLPDKPENYHTVTIELTGKGSQTLVSLIQDNNANQKEREHSEKNWATMLAGLKKFLEK